MSQTHTWQQLLSMCCQKTVKGSARKTVHPERTHDEWHSNCLDFFQLKIGATIALTSEQTLFNSLVHDRMTVSA